jgi:virginiamycin B lyase
MSMSRRDRFRNRPSVEPLEARRVLAVTINEFPIPSGTVGVVAGSDGAIWFPLDGQELGRMTTSGSLSRINVGAALTGGIEKGPDGAIWFTASMSRIGRRTLAGDVSFFDVPAGRGDRDPRIVADGDGNIWFTEQTANKLGRLTPAGEVTEFSLPTPAGGDP